MTTICIAAASVVIAACAAIVGFAMLSQPASEPVAVQSVSTAPGAATVTVGEQTVNTAGQQSQQGASPAPTAPGAATVTVGEKTVSTAGQQSQQEAASAPSAESAPAPAAAGSSNRFECEYFVIDPPDSFGDVSYSVVSEGDSMGRVYEVQMSCSAGTWNIMASSPKLYSSVTLPMEIGMCSGSNSSIKVTFAKGTDSAAHAHNSVMQPYVSAK